MKTQYKNSGLIGGFIYSLNSYPDRPALEVNNEEFTYLQLAGRANGISQVINKHSKDSALIAILGYRSITMYSGILGILLSGKGYVPLNPKFPRERTKTMVLESGCDTLLVGNESIDYVSSLLSNYTKPLTIIFPNENNLDNLISEFPQHTFVTSSEINQQNFKLTPPIVEPHQTAYLLFTSGSTGVPKGVPVNHKNVTSYIHNINSLYDFTYDDKFSQSFDMTFDLSVHDMFICWSNTACLYCVPESSIMAPAKFIKNKGINVWFSVPSVVMFMSKMRLLKPNSFPKLKYSFFCGEPLLDISAGTWQKAAPNSMVVNLYGPTEATIAISEYRWLEGSVQTSKNGIVPIGKCFENQDCCIVDEDNNVIDIGETGELCLSGSQVTNGYCNNKEKNAAHFIKIPKLGNEIWYKTGDIVTRDPSGCMYYLGRVDNQVQVLGYRVELQEIDSVLRKVSNLENVVSIAWPVENGTAQGVIAFICGDKKSNDTDSILNYCNSRLPKYMVPNKIYFVDVMPLNVNGKIDRQALIQSIEEQTYE